MNETTKKLGVSCMHIPKRFYLRSSLMASYINHIQYKRLLKVLTRYFKKRLHKSFNEFIYVQLNNQNAF